MIGRFEIGGLYGVLNKPAERGVCIVGNTGIEVFRRELWKQW
jgi:hypothetical protein